MNICDLFEKIVEDTKNSKISWKLVSKDSFRDVIFQSGAVFRLFVSNCRLNNQDVELLFVEKKTDDPEWDFAIEKYTSELIVLMDKEIVYTFTPEFVGKDEMLDLVEIIEEKNDKLRKLLGE